MIAAPLLSILLTSISATYETDPKSHGGNNRHSCRRAALLVHRNQIYVDVLLCRDTNVIKLSKTDTMKKASETTIIKALVNLKCLGYLGKCIRPFSAKERGRIIDELIMRGYIDEQMNVLPAAKPIIIANIALCE